MKGIRLEKDSMGEVEVPAAALYGAQTQRAIESFPVSGLPMPEPFIIALALIKKTAAECNQQLGLLDEDIAAAIIEACEEVLDYQHLQHFPVDVFQTGSGTSTNMNMNEVIASLASKALGKKVSANDHVNLGQSSNDVIPSAIHLSAVLELHTTLLPTLEYLRHIIIEKSKAVATKIKTGRTHLMDAMPVTMGQELEGWDAQLGYVESTIHFSKTQLLGLAQGGTAVGTGINAHPDFAKLFVDKLSNATGLAFHTSDNFFASLGGQDKAVILSGHLKALAVVLMKIANDLRWMNSGPLAGLGEISLQALQPGSSIMPGKVNPVIPESVVMVCAQVIGNDTTITVAGQSGNFQLNVMLPVIAYNLLQSIELLTNSMTLLANKAIKTFTVNDEVLQKALASNPVLVTALNPMIGYTAAAAIAQQAYQQQRPIIDVAEELTDIGREELLRLLDPARLTKGGIQK